VTARSTSGFRIAFNAARPLLSVDGQVHRRDFAKRGEAWRPPNIEDDMNALIAAEKALAQSPR
jgi:hypothetical protein